MAIGKERERETDSRENNYKKDSASLYEALNAYGDSDYYPCHMPGHKRSRQAGDMAEIYRMDITEIDGFDNLHCPQGILREAQERANRLYGADETFYLVNGSTCGVQAAILAVTEPGDEILIARNCHKSVYHAAIMQNLTAHCYYPEMIEEYGICDGVDAEEIGRLLEVYPNCKAVVITSPTYEGIISDVRAVARTVHAKGKILIVDEAHGAHLGLAKEMPDGAIQGGADLVVHSLHKTLPAMTQTALLHVKGNRVDRWRLRKALSMLQSSSPSYVLMASMDSCVRYVENDGAQAFSFLEKRYREFCRKISVCRHIHIGKMTDVSENKYHLIGWDCGKLIISAAGTRMNGQRLYEIFRNEFHLQMEMASENFVLAMMTIMDADEGWQRLADAILQIDGRIEEEIREETGREQALLGKFYRPKVQMKPAQAFYGERKEVPLQEAVGRVMADFINLYPPGIPLLAPGEVMDEALLARIEKSLRMGLQVQGVTPEKGVYVLS